MNAHLILYLIVSFLSLFMIIWIFYTPGSIYFIVPSLSEKHLMQIKRNFETHHMPVPVQTITKYYNQSMVLHLHVLPSGIWAILLPIQLSTRIRLQYRTFHRMCGYLFISMIPLIALGVFVILYKRLDYEYDYPSDLPTSHFSEWGLSSFNNTFYYYKISSILFTFYFVGSALQALKYTLRKDYYHHYIWIIRHISTGIWIAIMRIYVILRNAILIEEQRAAFYDGSILSIILTVCTGELYILYLSYTWKRKII